MKGLVSKMDLNDIEKIKIAKKHDNVSCVFFSQINDYCITIPKEAIDLIKIEKFSDIKNKK
jgi:hypothetical protein